MAREVEAGLDVTTLRCRPGRPAIGSGPAGTLAYGPTPNFVGLATSAPPRDPRTPPTRSDRRRASIPKRAEPV